MLSLVADLGARLDLRDEEGMIAGVPTYAEYDAGTNMITVYRPAIASLARLLSETLRSGEAETLALRLLIAHELFHHLEATRIPPASEQLPPLMVPVMAGLWRVRRRVQSSREIAAHAFAQTLTGLPLLECWR